MKSREGFIHKRFWGGKGEGGKKPITSEKDLATDTICVFSHIYSRHVVGGLMRFPGFVPCSNIDYRQLQLCEKARFSTVKIHLSFVTDFVCSVNFSHSCAQYEKGKGITVDSNSIRK